MIEKLESTSRSEWISTSPVVYMSQSFRCLAKLDANYKETDKTVESSADRCVGKIALVLNALIAIEGWLV